MNAVRRYTLTTALFGAVVLVHGLLTWPLRAVVAIYVAGMAVAFLGEAFVVRLGPVSWSSEPSPTRPEPTA